MKSLEILIAHAPGEEHRAETIAKYLAQHGIDAVHLGTILVGDSFIAHTSTLLDRGCPVVLCGTVNAMGTKWARQITKAAIAKNCPLYPLQMEQEAYLDDLTLDSKVLPVWQDEEGSLSQLVKALRVNFSEDHSQEFNLQMVEFESQKRRVDESIAKFKRIDRL